MEVYSILIKFGMPSLFTIVVAGGAAIIKFGRDMKILKSAVQNMMRAQLLKDGKQFLKDGEISELELYDWRSRYEAYHSLGKNGVLDALNNAIIQMAVDKQTSIL